MTEEKRQQIQARLEQLTRQGDGVLRPEVVVEDASILTSPLHDQFEWDNGAAGHRYRLEQARRLIRSVKVEVTIVDRVIAAPNYVRDPRDQPSYVTIARVRTEADLSRGVMIDEMRRIVAAITRARGLAVALGLEDELQALLERAVTVQQAAELRK